VPAPANWQINTISDLYACFRNSYASRVSSAVKVGKGNETCYIAQFSRYYADAFK
jgi:hypothetical protein